MTAILTPILVGFLTALSAVIIRYIEKKLMLDKVEGIKQTLNSAKAADTMPETNARIDTALTQTKSILNGRK